MKNYIPMEFSRFDFFEGKKLKNAWFDIEQDQGYSKRINVDIMIELEPYLTEYEKEEGQEEELYYYTTVKITFSELKPSIMYANLLARRIIKRLKEEGLSNCTYIKNRITA